MTLKTERRQQVSSQIRDTAQEMYSFLSEYIQRPSEAPKAGSSSVEACQLWLAEEMRRWGWQDWLDVWEGAPGEINLAVRIPGASGEPRLMFNGHSDVAPVPAHQADRWRHEPYGGHIDEDRVWGRGASDMKGGIASFLWAAKTVLDAGIALKHDLLLTMNVGEESARPEVGISTVIDKGFVAPLVLNAEPTNLRLNRGAMGWFFFDVTVVGRSSHPANNYISLDPSVPLDQKPAIDANDLIRKVMNELASMSAQWSVQSAANQKSKYSSSLTPVFIEGGSRAATVSDSARVTYAAVFDETKTSNDVYGAISDAMDQLAESNEWLKRHRPQIDMPVVDPVFEPIATREDAPAVREVADVVHEVLGQRPEIGMFPGPCDANLLPREGVDTVILGPGDLSFGCHGIDEYVPKEHLVLATDIYARLILQRCA